MQGSGVLDILETVFLRNGLLVAFAVVGAAIAASFGYRDPVELTTIGAGAVTYIVGPVTGEALGASGEVITLSVAAGLAAKDPKLVPYGAMTATFYTGVGCLLGPSVLYFLVAAIV